jgi:enoyl-CoA hydratase/carnithine racemase
MFTSAAHCRARPRGGTDLTGRLYDTEEALRIGFVNKVVEPDNLVNEVIAIAQRIVTNGHAFRTSCAECQQCWPK